MNINLKIEDREVELGTAELDFALNRTYEELSNPTVICNDWSKTISVPFSVTNNALFGSIFSTERKLLKKDDYPNVGTNFNASRKANFTLWYNSGLLMTGYAKLASVDNVNKTYNINLFGEVGNTFLDLLECTFNKGADVEGKYIINDPLAGGRVIDRNLVAESWRNDNPKLALEGCGTTDIVGFAPVVQGLPEGFAADTYLDGTGNFKKLSDLLNSAKSITYGDSIIKDGLTEQAMRQFRTRYQKPYIYVNKLWQILVEQSKKICKYPLHLDPIWFNARNPYYTDLVYLCTDLKENYEGEGTSFKERYAKISKNTATTVHYEKEANAPDIELNFYLNTGIMPVPDGILTINKEAYLAVKIKSEGSTLYNYAVVSKEQGAYKPEGYDGRTIYFDTTFSVGECAFSFTIPTMLQNLPDKFDIEYEWKYPLYPNYNYPYTLVANAHYGGGEWRYYEEGNTLVSISYTRALVSKDILSLTRLWNPDVAPFEVLLDYSKMFGLIFETDHKNECINVTCRNVYFQKAKVVDWTDKLNTLNTFTIEQPTFENKYVMFNYEDVDGGRYKTYKDKYQMAYGAKKLITEYEFNNDTENLFEGIYPCNFVNETYASYNDIFVKWTAGSSIPQSTSSEVMLDNEGDGSSLNVQSAFCFRRKNQSCDGNIGAMVYLTDDTIEEKNTDTFCYIDVTRYAQYVTPASSMPFLHYIDNSGLYSCLFNVPKEVYVTNKEEVENAICIYDAFWRDYINERYDANNKKVSTQINLSSMDYAGFRFNNLVKINNTLYVVNAIKDYGIGDGLDTDVELITVTNLGGYSKGADFKYAVFENNKLVVAPSAEATTFTIKTDRNFGSSAFLTKDDMAQEYVTILDGTVEYGEGEIRFRVAPFIPTKGTQIARTMKLYLNVTNEAGTTVMDTLTIRQLSYRLPVV